MPSRSTKSRNSPGLFDTAQQAAPSNYLVAYADGGARGNPGPAGYGVVVDDQDGKRVAELSEYLGHQTNNVAEYRGLLAALDYTIEHGKPALSVVSDSELLVRQVQGIYKVRHPALQELHRLVQQRIARLEWFSIRHVLREKNRVADQLANAAMDRGTSGKVQTSL